GESAVLLAGSAGAMGGRPAGPSTPRIRRRVDRRARTAHVRPRPESTRGSGLSRGGGAGMGGRSLSRSGPRIERREGVHRFHVPLLGGAPADLNRRGAYPCSSLV